jgi:hypothetical protein
MRTSTRKTWRTAELNLVKGASKQRQAEDKLRADAWQKNREAELEAVVNRSYNGMDIPEIAALVAKASEVMAPYIAEFDRLFAEHYPGSACSTGARSHRPTGVREGAAEHYHHSRRH